MAGLDTHRLKCADEPGVNLAMAHTYARRPRGERVIGSVPQNFGARVTVLGTLGAHGLQVVMTVKGTTDAAVGRMSVKRTWAPALGPGEIVVMDNLRVQEAGWGQQALARRGAPPLSLPPHALDLSPSEPCWGKVNIGLRLDTARTCRAMDNAIAHAIATVTRIDAHGWFMHCSYALR